MFSPGTPPTSEAPGAHAPPDGRAAGVRWVLWITLALNLAVALAKLICGTLTHTLSMIADGYHSMLDGAGNVVGLLALSAAHQPPDEDHHYGHRKFEVLASIGIAALLFIAAFEILASAWSRLKGTSDLAIFSPFSIAVMVITMGVNLGVSRYEARRGRELSSPFLVADSRHTASDLYASASVLVALIALRLGLTWLDPLAAIVIGGVIVLAGWKILRWSMGVLADKALIDKKAIEAVILEFPAVRACRQIRTRGFADVVFVDLTLLLDASLTLRAAHDLCDRIEERLRQAFPVIADILVHPEPDLAGAPEVLTGAAREE